ncbi:MAG: metallophosphoesterase family protein, partial [Thermomicrobiales bacterium]
RGLATGHLQSLHDPQTACQVLIGALRAHPVSLWLLGHIHKAKHEKLHAHASALYPGSPYAMDPGETGTHGYWLAEFEPSEPVRLAHIALSPVRYDAETVDVSAVVEEDEFRSVITDAMLRVGERAVSESGEGVVSVVSCRMELIGSCSAHHQLREWSTNAFNDLSVTVGTLVVGLDRVSQDVYPPIDLMERAKYNDPVGEAARLLLGLDLPIAGSPYSDLVGRTLRVLTDVHKHNAYGELKSKEDATSVAGPTEMDAVGLLKTQAWRIVSELVTAKAKA